MLILSLAIVDEISINSSKFNQSSMHLHILLITCYLHFLFLRQIIK